MKKIQQESENIENMRKSNARSYSEEVESLRSSSLAGLRRRGYDRVVVERPVERGDGSLVYVKVYAEGGGDLPNMAVECFREISGSVSGRFLGGFLGVPGS